MSFTKKFLETVVGVGIGVSSLVAQQAPATPRAGTPSTAQASRPRPTQPVTAPAGGAMQSTFGYIFNNTATAFQAQNLPAPKLPPKSPQLNIISDTIIEAGAAPNGSLFISQGAVNAGVQKAAMAYAWAAALKAKTPALDLDMTALSLMGGSTPGNKTEAAALLTARQGQTPQNALGTNSAVSPQQLQAAIGKVSRSLEPLTQEGEFMAALTKAVQTKARIDIDEVQRIGNLGSDTADVQVVVNALNGLGGTVGAQTVGQGNVPSGSTSADLTTNVQQRLARIATANIASTQGIGRGGSNG